MKKIVSAMNIVAIACCNAPFKITTKTDPHTTTCGTMGSAKFNNELPLTDTSNRVSDATGKKGALSPSIRLPV